MERVGDISCLRAWELHQTHHFLTNLQFSLQFARLPSLSLCWWWLSLQLSIKCSIHFSDWPIKALLCEWPSSALFRACRRVLQRHHPLLSEASTQLTQSLLSGCGSKWTEETLSLSVDAEHPGIKLGMVVEVCLCLPVIFSFAFMRSARAEQETTSRRLNSPIHQLFFCSVWKVWLEIF